MKLKLLAAAVLPLAAVLVYASDLLGQGKVPLAGNPFADWNNKTVMIFSPHPDDDIIGCGGGPAVLSGPGKRLIVVFLTKGGEGAIGNSLRSFFLAGRRRQEGGGAFRRLGVLDGPPILARSH